MASVLGNYFKLRFNPTGSHKKVNGYSARVCVRVQVFGTLYEFQMTTPEGAPLPDKVGVSPLLWGQIAGN